MIPIYVHRFMPSEPSIEGNPVFSIWQLVDTIHFGTDLADYLAHEFGVMRPEWSAKKARPIRYWQDVWRFSNTPKNGVDESDF
jgi:hypothetical protein